jgi:hypothetical protein
MKVLIKLLTALAPLFRRLGTCAITGSIAGVFTGFILWLWFFIEAAPPSLSPTELVQITFLFAFASWLLLLFVLVPLTRLRFADIWYTALVNVLITDFLAILAIFKLNLANIGYLVGLLIGIFVGLILCYINNYLKEILHGVLKQNSTVRG